MPGNIQTAIGAKAWVPEDNAMIGIMPARPAITFIDTFRNALLTIARRPSVDRVAEVIYKTKPAAVFSFDQIRERGVDGIAEGERQDRR